jgi:hypothetical protein
METNGIVILLNGLAPAAGTLGPGAILQLPFTEAVTAEWLFPREKAALSNAG